MTGYLEIFGQSFTTPDPDSVASLSARYSGLCATIAEAKDGLNAIGSPQASAEWVGQAADTFASKLSNLPGQLEQAWQSYDAVARALSGYASSLRPVVSALNSLASQAEEAEGTLSATQAAREQAIRQGEPSASTVWNARVSEAQAAVNQLKRRQSTLLAELASCSSDCVRQVQQAAHESIHSSLITDLGHDLADIGRVAWRAGDDGLHFGVTVVKDLTIEPFVSLVTDADKFWDSQSWVDLGKCLDDISAVLAVCSVALGVAALVCPPLAVAAGALYLASMGVGALGLEADLFAELSHEKGASWTQVEFDAAGLLLMGVGRVIGQGIEVFKLADGPGAEVPGRTLWDTGASHFFDLDPGPGDVPHGVPDPGSENVPHDAQDPDPEDASRNAPSTGPAKHSLTTYKHVNSAIGHVNDGVTVGQDQWQKDQGQ
jgi:hypothetical protein